MRDPAELIIDQNLLDKWVKNGAVLSEGIRKILHHK